MENEKSSSFNMPLLKASELTGGSDLHSSHKSVDVRQSLTFGQGPFATSPSNRQSLTSSRRKKQNFKHGTMAESGGGETFDLVRETQGTRETIEVQIDRHAFEARSNLTGD